MVKDNSKEGVTKKLSDGTVFYHGSDQKFDHFELGNYGKNGVAGGRGVYITSDKEHAKKYTGKINESGYLYQVTFDPGRELSATDLTMDKKEVSKFVDVLDRKYDYLENWGDVDFEGHNKVKQEAVSSLIDNSNDVDLYNEVINEVGSQPEALHALRQVDNFTHTIVPHEDADFDEIVVLNPNDVKITKRLKREKTIDQVPKSLNMHNLKVGIQGIGGINTKKSLTR